MRKAAIEGTKRDEIEQFVALANLLKPKPGAEWPDLDPDEVDALELAISRASDPGGLQQRRDALLDPLWKAARRLFPPRASDGPPGWPRAERSHVVVLRRSQMASYIFGSHGAAELYRAAWTCRRTLIAIARAAGAEGSYGTTLELPPAPRRIQIVGGRLGADFDRFFLGALEDVDLTMIRLCDCGLVYLARRARQTGCSKRCANRIRQKAFRKEHPDYHRRHTRVIRALAGALDNWREFTVFPTIPEPFPEVA